MQYDPSSPPLEIERKRSISGDVDAFVRHLSDHGFREIHASEEVDAYYSRPDVDFRQTIECLRVRERDGFAEITYKPVSTDATHTDSNVITKPETNLQIQHSDAATAEQLLVNLGMVHLVTVRKHRRTFKDDAHPDVAVAVDEVEHAGAFVEVETIGDDTAAGLEKVVAVENQLDIGSLAIIDTPYRDIVRQAQKDEVRVCTHLAEKADTAAPPASVKIKKSRQIARFIDTMPWGVAIFVPFGLVVAFALLAFMMVAVTGGHYLDGLFGVRRNTPFQDIMIALATIVVLISPLISIAFIITFAIRRKDLSIHKRLAPIYTIAILCLLWYLSSSSS